MDIDIKINILFVIVLLILLIMFYMLFFNKLEHLTNQSDEAIQNVASLYNKDELTIGSMTITGKTETKDLTASTFNLLPKGIIVAWNGGPTPPTGWALCNGQNGTPDLSERFILATTNPAYFAPNYQTGGASSVALSVAHLPAHDHKILIETSGGWNGWNVQGSDRGINYGSSNNTKGCNGCAGQAFSIWNPYYRLAYIMKL